MVIKQNSIRQQTGLAPFQKEIFGMFCVHVSYSMYVFFVFFVIYFFILFIFIYFIFYYLLLFFI